MKNLLIKIGFKNVQKKLFGIGDFPDVEKLDTLNGLFVETKK